MEVKSRAKLWLGSIRPKRIRFRGYWCLLPVIRVMVCLGGLAASSAFIPRVGNLRRAVVMRRSKAAKLKAVIRRIITFTLRVDRVHAEVTLGLLFYAMDWI